MYHLWSYQEGARRRPCSGYVVPSARVKRAVDRTAAALQHMGIDHGGTHVLVSQEFLQGTDIVAVLQQMRGETVPQGVTAAALGDAGLLESLFYGSLEHRFRHMVSALNSRTRIDGAFRGGKDILPDPGCAGTGAFTFKGVWQVHLYVSCDVIVFMEELHPSNMLLLVLCQRPCAP